MLPFVPHFEAYFDIEFLDQHTLNTSCCTTRQNAVLLCDIICPVEQNKWHNFSKKYILSSVELLYLFFWDERPNVQVQCVIQNHKDNKDNKETESKEG